MQARVYLSKKRRKTNFKLFQYQILTSVKRSEKQLASKANLEVFCNLNALILSWNCVTGVRINKIVERIKFEGV